MATIFPSSPTLDQKHTSNGVTWKWTGYVWELSMDNKPPPFYMHTHSYDGEVHTIDVQNIINFNDDLNNNASVVETIPAIIGLDGGSPNSSYSNPTSENFTLLDGGEIGN